MNAGRWIDVLQSTEVPGILVLGDLMLDVYTTGHAERISPESPVIILRAGEQRSVLGGAACVCQMLRGWKAEVACAGVVGEDDAGRSIERLLDAGEVNRDLVLADATRQTTVKERFLGASAARMPSQMLRVDRESREPISYVLEDELLRGLCDKLPDQQALLISDYAKGVCTPRLVHAAIRAARQAGVPVLVDPLRGGDYEIYRGATVLKPNRLEAEAATGIPIRQPEDARRAGRRLCEQLGIQHIVITLDRDGIVLVTRQGPDSIFPTETRNVCDITGAGDMVLAVLGYCVASGVALEDAVQLANVAASLEVQRIGVAVITREDIQDELLVRRREPGDKIVTGAQARVLAELHRRRGHRVALTNGCFDLLHVGHVASLTAAASHGDVLIVGLNSDSSVRRLKGAGRPIIAETERAAMLAALSCVGYVVLFEEDTPSRLLQEIRPDVLVKGGTYSPDQIVGREIVESYGGQVRLTEVVDGVSTSRILQSAVERSRTSTGPARKAA